MPITIYPGSMKKRNANGSYSDLVPAIATDPEVLDDFAEEYSTSETYNIGDYCIHNSDLYKCNTNNTTGTWNNNAWDRVTVADELADHKNTLNQLGNDVATILQDPAQDTFAEGTYVVYNNQLYTVAVGSGGIPMDTPASSYYPSKLTAVPGGGLNDLKNNLESLVKSIPINDTTDSTGDINTGLVISYRPICFVNSVPNQSTPYMFFNTSATWWIKFVKDSNVTNNASVPISGTLYYI